MDDPYAVLGLDRHAGEAEIKKAYRALAKVWHPDRHGDDFAARERFVEINQAYQLLLRAEAGGERPPAGGSGKARRRRAAKAMKPDAPLPGGRGGDQPEPSDDEMMERIFGVAPLRWKIDDAPSLDAAADTAPRRPQTGTGGPRSRHGRTVLLALNALFGRRTRAEDSESEKTGGTDLRAEPLRAGVRVPLATALAGGEVEATLPDGRPVTVDIAPRTREGTVLTLSPEHCGTPQPVELTVVYASCDTFWREGTDLHTALAVDLETAVLGGAKTLDTPDGPVRLTVPAWSGSERRLRIGGRGLPDGDDRRGDLLVHLRVMLPQSADPRIVELMEKRRQGLFV